VISDIVAFAIKYPPYGFPDGGVAEIRKPLHLRGLLESSFGYGKSITGVITTSQ
jgi:hypothetical protein